MQVNIDDILVRYNAEVATPHAASHLGRSAGRPTRSASGRTRTGHHHRGERMSITAAPMFG